MGWTPEAKHALILLLSGDDFFPATPIVWCTRCERSCVDQIYAKENAPRIATTGNLLCNECELAVDSERRLTRPPTSGTSGSAPSGQPSPTCSSQASRGQSKG